MRQNHTFGRRTLLAAATAIATTFAFSAASAQETYRILSLLDYSGPFANRGTPVEQMQRLLVDWYNETRGAKRGVVLEFEPVDTGYDQARTVQAFERAAQDPGLIGVVTFGSPNVIAIQKRLPESRIPAVHGGPAYSLMEPGSWVFTPLNDYARYFAAAVGWKLKSRSETDPMTVAFVTFDGSSGRDWAGGFEPMIADMNAKVVLTEFISPRALDVAVNVERIVDADPDMVIVATTDQLQPLVLGELHASGFDMTRVVNSQHEGLGLLELLGVAPEVYEGTYEVTSENYVDLTTEAYRIYEERKDRYKTRWSADTLLHFPSTLVLLDAIDRAVETSGGARIDGNAVYAALANGTFDGRGLLEEIRFENDVDPTLGARSVVMLQQRNGKIETVSDFLPLAD